LSPRRIPLNPPFSKREVNKDHLATAPKGPPLLGEVPEGRRLSRGRRVERIEFGGVKSRKARMASGRVL